MSVHRLPLSRLMATEVLADDRALRTGRRERALAQMEAARPRRAGAGTPGQRALRHRGAAVVGGGNPAVRPDLRGGPWHRCDPPEQHMGRGGARGDPARASVRAGLEPDDTIEVLKDIDGAATARRVGTDAISPTFAQLLPMAFPNAELVDGELADAGRAADQDARRGGGAARARSRSPRRDLAAAVAELRPGHHRADAGRRAAGGDGRGRGEHLGHPGRRLGDLAGPSVATRQRRRPGPSRRPGGVLAGVLGRRLRRRGRPHLAGRRRQPVPRELYRRSE